MNQLKEVKMSIQEERIVENNAIIDHLVAVREIVARKCARCKEGGCMGCIFDELDANLMPTSINRLIALMKYLPNERQAVVMDAELRERERKAIFDEKDDN
jgi:hypothetical protein